MKSLAPHKNIPPRVAVNTNKRNSVIAISVHSMYSTDRGMFLCSANDLITTLSTAKVMIVYASSMEYVLSTWLRNEWYRYVKKIEAGEKQENSLIVAYDGFSPSELPTVLSLKQCIDASRNNRRFYGDLDTCIRKIIDSYPEKSKNADRVPKSIPIVSEFHEHKYKTQLVKGTCIARGYTLYRCDCGYEYKSNFSDLTDHDYGDCKVIAATCTQNGKKEYVCSVCGEIKTEILPQIPHTFTSWTERIHPSCTVDGESFRQCSSCGLVEKRKIDKLGHKFGQWQKNEQGIEVRHCLNCGYTETDKTAFLRKEERKKKKQEKALILNTRRELKKAKKLEKNGQKQEAMSIYYHYAYDAGIGFALFKVFEYEIENPDLYRHAIISLEKAAATDYVPAKKFLEHLDKTAFKSLFHTWPRYAEERRPHVLNAVAARKRYYNLSIPKRIFRSIWFWLGDWGILIAFFLFMFMIVYYALSI